MEKRATTKRMRLMALLPSLALAAALAAMPGYAPFDGMDGAVLAKSDKANGGNKGGNGGNKSANKSSKAKSTKVSADGYLHPSQKGKWNAMNANQAALDAHIANGNSNGTIGALTQMQVAAKAASGAELTDEELAFMEGAGYEAPEGVDINAELNKDAVEGDPVYEVDADGMVSCTENCGDGIDEATLQEKQDLADSLAEEQADAQQEAYDKFMEDSKQRIIDESNKELSEEEQEQLFDEMGAKWGYDLTPEEAIEEDPLAEEGVLLEEEVANL